MARTAKYLRGFATLGFLAYFIGAGLMLGGIVALGKEDFVEAGICGLTGVLFVAVGLVQIHEEKFHKKSQQ